MEMRTGLKAGAAVAGIYLATWGITYGVESVTHDSLGEFVSRNSSDPAPDKEFHSASDVLVQSAKDAAVIDGCGAIVVGGMAAFTIIGAGGGY